MALFSVCSVFEGCRLVLLFYLFIIIIIIYLFILFIIFILRGVACSVYGALGWDPCGVYSVSRFLLGIGVGRLWRFSALVAFMRHAGWSVYFIYFFIVWRGVALRVAFMGHWGGALVAFTAFGAFMRRLGWSFFAHFECLQRLGGIGAGPLWRLQC